MIVKNITLPNDTAATFHVVKRLTVTFPALSAQVEIHSFATEQRYLDGSPPLWSTPLTVPLNTLSGAPLQTLESWLIDAPDSPLIGGAIVADPTDDLVAVKQRKRTQIQALRDAAEYGGFVWDGSAFGSDATSRARVTGAVLAALLALQSGNDFAVTWRLADDTQRTLSKTNMFAVGGAFFAHVQSVFETADMLLLQVDAAMNHADVEVIAWPA